MNQKLWFGFFLPFKPVWPRPGPFRWFGFSGQFNPGRIAKTTRTRRIFLVKFIHKANKHNSSSSVLASHKLRLIFRESNIWLQFAQTCPLGSSSLIAHRRIFQFLSRAPSCDQWSDKLRIILNVHFARISQKRSKRSFALIKFDWKRAKRSFAPI